MMRWVYLQLMENGINGWQRRVSRRERGSWMAFLINFNIDNGLHLNYSIDIICILLTVFARLKHDKVIIALHPQHWK